MKVIMKIVSAVIGVCSKCGKNDLEFLGGGRYRCKSCGNIGNAKEWV